LSQASKSLEGEEEVPAKVSSWPELREDGIATWTSAVLKISGSCHKTFHILTLDKMASLFPHHKISDMEVTSGSA